MKQFFNQNKILIGSLVFLIVYSVALITFATPPGSPYTAGETLDPTCSPIDTNCFVSIFPDQTGNNGKYLVTNGSNISWASVTAGTVTSVGLSMPTGFSVASSPVTGNGTLEVTTILDGVVIGAGGGFSTATVLTPLSYSAGTLSINNASADGSTKGAATYLASDFDSSGGLISIDYANGQTASGSTKGFLAAADWTTFNNKIGSLNGLTASSQTFAVGTSGSDFNISSSVSTHTFNLPDAGASTRGLVTTGTQTFAGTKTFSSAPVFSTMTSGSVLFAGTSGALTQDNTNLFWDDTNNRLGILDSSPNAALTVGSGDLFQVDSSGNILTVGTITDTRNSIGSSSTDGIILQNTTAAAVGVQQMSPRLHFIGKGWKTDATAGSQSVDFIQEVLPVQGTSNPTGIFQISSSINGGLYGSRLKLGDDGGIIVGNNSVTNSGKYINIIGYNNTSATVTTGTNITYIMGTSNTSNQTGSSGVSYVFGDTNTTNNTSGVTITIGSINVNNSSGIIIGNTNQNPLGGALIGTGNTGTSIDTWAFGSSNSGIGTFAFGKNNSGSAGYNYAFSIGQSNAIYANGTSTSNSGALALGYSNSISTGTYGQMFVAGSGITMNNISANEGTFNFGWNTTTGNKPGLQFKSRDKNILLLGTDTSATNFDTSAVNAFVMKNGTAWNSSSIITDTSVFYVADIAAGKASPHFLTEDGAIIGLGSDKFGLRSNNDLNLTANDVVGATLSTAGNFSVTNGSFTDNKNSIGTTSTDGIILQNTTAAAVGAQQMSPRLHFIGQGWKTNATAGSQTVDMVEELLPVQGTTAPTSYLRWSSQINSGGYSPLMVLSSGGMLGINQTSPTARLHIKSTGSYYFPEGAMINVTDSAGANVMYLNDQGSIAIGHSSSNYNGTSVAIGHAATTAYFNAVALGDSSYANGGTAIGYGSYSNGPLMYPLSLGYQMRATGSGSVMIGNMYTSSVTNDIAGSLKFTMANNTTDSDAKNQLFVGYYGQLVLNRNTNILNSIGGSVYDRVAQNTITLTNANVASGTGTITSASSGTGGVALFALSSAITGITTGDKVVVDFGSTYTDGTYFYRDISTTTFSLYTTRNSALDGGVPNALMYTSSDTGTVTPQVRIPAQVITDASQFYTADISAGKSSPHFLTEDGAIIGLGSGKFGLRSNNDLNLTANDVVGATLAASTGFFGIGDTTPDYLLDVENTGVDGNIFALHDSDGECLHNPEAGSETVTCSSDERLKTNIVDASSMLPYLDAFHIRQYDVIASNDHLTGVIAQEVQQLYPDLVTVADNGYLSVASPNTWQLIKAIQELDIKLEPLTSLDLNTSGSFSSLIKQYLESVTNGLTKIFTGEVHTDLLCVGQTCVTESQLQTLLNQQNNNTSTTGDGTTGGGTGDTPQDTTPPVITLMGEQSIQLTVGDTYTEQGATATDDTDGDVTANIIISGTVDTTTIGTYTVTYIVTDSAGNVSEATRVVVVE